MKRALLPLCLALAACGGESTTPPPPDLWPTLQLATADSTYTRSASLTVSGTATDDRAVSRVGYQVDAGPVQWIAITPGPSVAFSAEVALPPGLARITVTAEDAAGHQASRSVTAYRSTSRLIAAQLGPFNDARLVLFDSEGEGRRDLGAVGGMTSDRTGAAPDWSPSQDQLVFHTGYAPGFVTRVYVADPATGARRPLLANSPFIDEQYPAFSHDGQWIYFAGGNPDSHSIWRARPDGSQLERVGFTGASPSPSPDDTRFVYHAEGYPYTPWLAVRDLRTGATTDLRAAGYEPRWSPTEDLIAYIEPYRSDGLGRVVLIRPDGTGRRVLSPEGVGYTRSLDWSPDGKSVLVRSFEAASLEVIDVASGAVRRVAKTGEIHDAAW